MYKKIGKVGLLIGVMSTALYAESVLRVSCEDSNSGASIYINDEPKGTCPTDLFLEPGSIRLKAVLRVDREHERVYEKQIHLSDGSAQRVEVILSSSQLTASARKARREQKLNRQKREAATALRMAEVGNIEAMEKLSRYYAEGLGLERNNNQANFWAHKAKGLREKNEAMTTLRSAKAGNIDSMKKLAGFYREGRGIERNYTEAEKWSTKASDLENAKQAKMEKEAKDRELRAELKTIDFFSNTKRAVKDSKEGIRKNPAFITTAPFMMGTSIVFDLVLAPVRTTQKKILESKLSARASSWKNPKSMMAKAYRKKYELNHAQEKKVVSLR